MDWFIVYIAAACLIIPCIIFGSYASVRVNEVYEKNSKIPSKSGMASYELAKKLLDKNGITDVSIAEINGRLSDCYDPKHKVVKLSTATIRSTSVAALGVTAHELGHVVQDHKKMFLFRFRNFFVPIVNFVSRAFVPILVVGTLLSFTFYIPEVGNIICWISVVLYGLSFIFYLITLPLEVNASRRAMKMLEELGEFDSSELAKSKEVLNAAILTYISAFATSFVYFLRFLSYAFLFFDSNKK